MPIAQSMLPEFDHEMSTTRRVLERVSFEKAAWKPHEKSFTMGDLATHVCHLPNWLPITIQTASLDLEPPGGPKVGTAPLAASPEECLTRFDKAVAEARAALAGASDAAMMEPWSLLRGGKQVFTMPRVACVRGFVLNHLIHHRGQLSVYLRLNDVPVPSIYGPSAD